MSPLRDSFIPVKLRRRRKRRVVAPPPMPATPDQILSVAFGPGADQVTVTLSSAVVAITDPPLGMWIYFEDADAATPIAAECLGTVVVFTYAVDVSTGINWGVEDYNVWQMADAGPLVEPFFGALP